MMKLIGSIIITILAVIPTCIMYLFWNLTGPVGFWQVLTVSVLGFCLLGAIQFMFLILWFGFLFAIWTDKEE